MGQTMTPRGVTKKQPCSKCGRLYYATIQGSSLKVKKTCNICVPIEDKKEKENV